MVSGLHGGLQVFTCSETCQIRRINSFSEGKRILQLLCQWFKTHLFEHHWAVNVLHKLLLSLFLSDHKINKSKLNVTYIIHCFYRDFTIFSLYTAKKGVRNSVIFEKFIRDKVSLLDTGVRINALKAITDTREETAAPLQPG